MVITDIPFDRPNNLQKRYEFLRTSNVKDSLESNNKHQYKAEDAQDYATFLREEEEAWSRRSPVRQKLKSKLLKPIVKGSECERVDVVKLSSMKEGARKEHEKKMKIIEDHMWHEKQEERELKRVEGDILKNQRAVRHTLRDCENAINKKSLAEEKHLNQSLDKYTQLQKDELHRKEQLIQSRIHQNTTNEHADKDAGRKIELQNNDCMRQFQVKMAELQLRRVEIDAMGRDFEQKMKQHEESEHALKQQIAEIVLVMNMNALKDQKVIVEKRNDKKVDALTKISNDLNAERSLENKVTKGDQDIKAADMHKRKLSASLQRTKAQLSIKSRDEQRHLTDTQKRLADNSQTQQQLNEAAIHADLERKTREIDIDIKTHNTRKKTLMLTAMKEKKERLEMKQSVCAEKFRKRHLVQQAHVYDDNVRHLQKCATKNEEAEQKMYNQVRSAEYTRLKQGQVVQRWMLQLEETKRKNSVLLKELAVKIQLDETQLNHKIQREVAALDKVNSERAEKYMQLQKHRVVVRQDQYLLNEFNREHKRAKRVTQTSS